jgi:hypothetical protein
MLTLRKSKTCTNYLNMNKLACGLFLGCWDAILMLWFISKSSWVKAIGRSLKSGVIRHFTKKGQKKHSKLKANYIIGNSKENFRRLQHFFLAQDFLMVDA